MSQEQGKVKLRGQIATEQEKLLGDRDTELGECRDQLRDSKQLLDSVNNRIELSTKFCEVSAIFSGGPCLRISRRDGQQYCGHFATFC